MSDASTEPAGLTTVGSPKRLDVVSIGEGQLRLVAPIGTPLGQTSMFLVHVSGSEGNVLGLLARLGHPVGLVSALPDNTLGHRVTREYREAGIDISSVLWRASGRVALYFVENGSQPIPSRVFYDRAGSSFASMTRDDVNWTYLDNARMLHISGITAALTENLYDILLEAANRARSKGQLLSVDVNYRRLLWESPARARERMEPLVADAEVLFCSRRDAFTVFGIDSAAGSVSEQLSRRFRARVTIVSDGARAVEVLVDGERFTAEPPATHIVDRVGAGDALIGGFLHGVLRSDFALGLRLGITAAALSLTRYGDQLDTSLDELLTLSASLGNQADILR